MFLSKLEIFGFKSFANRTNIMFNRGITGIVGPNGCGKTNIVDAIRWVLGEQKTTTLRSDKMENVIFNGTRERKPMGMSEASLTLVNDRGILPTEYSEVTITRRIFRSGESEYLLNKNICRLKDITNLFMDTGMGTNAYSVIELKMVETILSSKAEERRRLFEEAAGVNKYKLRRRLSLKKLEDVKADLTRVNDIVSEVEKTVRSLERQAKRADQHNQIQSVLRDKEIDLAEREFALYNRKNAELKCEIESLVAQKDTTDGNIRTIENELIVFRNQINSIESELQNKRNEISSNTDQLHQAQKTISVSEERFNSLQNNHNRLISEIEELKKRLLEIDGDIKNLENESVSLNETESVKSIEIETNESLIGQKRNTLEEKRAGLKKLVEERFNFLKDISDKENLKSALEKEIQSHSSNIEKLNVKIQNITNRIAKTVGFVEELINEKTEAEKKLTEAGLQIALREKEKTELESVLNSLKEKEIEEKSLLTSLREKIEFLQTLISNLEGISKGSKVLLENKEWSSSEKNIFAYVGNTQDKYKFALEAGLKSVLNNLLIETVDELQEAITYLKNNDLGKASFYLLKNNLNGRKSLLEKLSDYSIRRKIRKIEKEASFIGWAKDFVETDDRWKRYFDQVLSRIAIASELKDAIRLQNKYPDFGFVTLDGDLIQSSGIIEAGSMPKQDETLFGRKQMLENLKKEYPKHESQLEKVKSLIAETELKLSKIDIKNLSDGEKLISNDIANIDKQISQLEFEHKKANEEIESSQKEIHEFVEKSNLLDKQLNELTSLLTELKNNKDNLDEEISGSETSLQELEQEFNVILESQNSLRLELERIKGQIKNTFDSINRSRNDSISINNGITKRESDLEINSSETKNLTVSIDSTRTELEKINEVRSVLVNEAGEIENKLKILKEEAGKYEKQLNDLRRVRQEVSDKIHSFEIKVNELNFRLENIQQHINENYSIEIVLKHFDDLDSFNFEETSKEVHSLKDKLKNLGPVNLLAYSEYEEERTRLDFLHKQRDDLIESERDLIKTINEINDTAQRLFIETFDQIRQNFTNIFQTLFNPGDEADLILEENVDPLEAKIEIIAKPKGKRPTSIELLSGGEKTLTATALLFAIYLVKPSPFCILDEVDAPLDDANIDRFTKLLKEFSNRTQFIIVTHNKRTMESAETMYGVTMQEEGISKLVGVRFEEIPDTQE
ncbi:MAG TPA: chromosome segregation protein SMC [Melioribacteraceae bacterium]|nr:chromosome segregation protein SMC [Melioribacteraceae bacterium]